MWAKARPGKASSYRSGGQVRPSPRRFRRLLGRATSAHHRSGGMEDTPEIRGSISKKDMKLNNLVVRLPGAVPYSPSGPSWRGL